METDKPQAENGIAPDPDQAAPETVADDRSAGRSADESDGPASAPREMNGPKGPEPTRYGDWEQKGRCSDF